ncbi:MAG: TetR/AcrR family transcriptional regulator [Demequina sp.]|uniref:TetR/AcrR family transcriptional regulator n=1 Tax=Demequina sp. TaxID=2050685 RepID=UPI003A8762C5
MTQDRLPLSRERVVSEAMALADTSGLEALSMRTLADRLGVVPMALYKHVRNKEELLDAMVDAVVTAIGPAPTGGDWLTRARALIGAARHEMLRHPWAWRAIETREAPSPPVLDHMEAMLQVLGDGGLSVDLAHHTMHALGSRLWGFSQEVFASPAADAGHGPDEATLAMLAARWPGVLASAASARHQVGSTVGPGCDDDAEFAFALDLILEGAARLADAGWSPPLPPTSATPAS